MNIYPIGTVVTLVNGEQELMITARFPLYENNGKIGYFEYAGCFYPQGQLNGENYFFNTEDIDTVHFIGYITAEEESIQSGLADKIKSIPYPKIEITDTL